MMARAKKTDVLMAEEEVVVKSTPSKLNKDGLEKGQIVSEKDYLRIKNSKK